MRSITPAAGLAAVAAVVILAGSAIAYLPVTAADGRGQSDARSGSGPTIAIAMLTADPAESFWPTPTVYLVVPTPTPAPPTPKPTPKPTAKPTAKPIAKPIAKPKAIVPIPDTVAGARTYVKSRIGVKQYNCINAIFTRESKWNPRAGTLTGAYGIPQAFPGSKMAKFGSNWRTSPITQVKWGIWYVNDPARYGSACAAWAFWQAHGWY